MKTLLTALLIFISVGCGYIAGYGIDQRVVPWLGEGYNVQTTIWKDGDIIWAHYTFQENRLYIPLDSIEVVKERDYQEAKRVMKILKSSNFQP